MASVGQAFKQNFDREVIRGHFDVGSAPEVRRFYCLVDTKNGKREPNGVSGQPVPRPDGMTGLKPNAVSLYSCASAEDQQLLVTTGYVLSGPASRSVSTAKPAAKPTPVERPPETQVEKPALASTVPATAADKVDVAGVKLGMSPDDVRAVLKSQKRLDYAESTGTLSHLAVAGNAPTLEERFVNLITAWTATSGAGGEAGMDAESYEVMFTPVPGKERAMAIVHTVSYSPSNAVRETVLASGLAKKYGGYTAASELPAAPTWRIQSAGAVQVGDACDRRSIFGGLSEVKSHGGSRANTALKTTPDEFQFQIAHCGVAIVTEDHAAESGGATNGDRRVTRFTVTAYSPLIGFEGATKAAQLMQMGPDKAVAPQSKDAAAPNL